MANGTGEARVEAQTHTAPVEHHSSPAQTEASHLLKDFSSIRKGTTGNSGTAEHDLPFGGSKEGSAFSQKSGQFRSNDELLAELQGSGDVKPLPGGDNSLKTDAFGDSARNSMSSAVETPESGEKDLGKKISDFASKIASGASPAEIDKAFSDLAKGHGDDAPRVALQINKALKEHGLIDKYHANGSSDGELKLNGNEPKVDNSQQIDSKKGVETPDRLGDSQSNAMMSASETVTELDEKELGKEFDDFARKIKEGATPEQIDKEFEKISKGFGDDSPRVSTLMNKSLVKYGLIDRYRVSGSSDGEITLHKDGK